jgi:GPH family glycoside/pentoside/hexuronide:cation symporter
LFPARSPQAYQAIGFASGVAFIPPLLITFLGTRERADFQAAEPLPLRRSLGFVARNKPFRYAVALRLLSWIPVVIVQAVFAYYLTYWTGMTEDETSIVQGVILAMAFLCLPVVFYLSRRFEKRRAYIISAASWLVVMLGIFLIPRGMKAPVYVVGVLAGLGVSAAHVIPSAMMPDVMEVDELESGSRQEGAYAGITVFIDKLARMLALAVLPMVLRWTGYVQPEASVAQPVQPPSALMALRIFVSVVPAVLLALSIAVARVYPLTRARYGEIQRELEARRA